MEEFLNYDLFKFGNYHVSVYHLVILGVLGIVTWLVLWLLKKAIFRSSRIDTGRKYAVYQIIRYFLLVLVVIIGLESLGVSLTVFLAGSAALLVGIGLGLQNLFNDFISGIILLIDGSVEVNDVIEVNGLVARVMAINLRTSVVRTRDEKYIILPNSILTGGSLINWTHHSDTSRFNVTVGVSYSADIDKVMQIMTQIATAHPLVATDQKPFARLINFGDSSIDFEVLFWTKEVFRVDNIKSDIRIGIWQSFREQGVEIPFPQRVVHHVGKPS